MIGQDPPAHLLAASGDIALPSHLSVGTLDVNVHAADGLLGAAAARLAVAQLVDPDEAGCIG